jgi:hypothetical protein
VNFKKRISTVGVTSLIVLGSISAASAQSTTTVELVDDVAQAGCSVSITAGAAISFEDVEWTGSAYDASSLTPKALTFTVADDRAPGEKAPCYVLVHGADLTTGIAPFTNRSIDVSNILFGAQALSLLDQQIAGSPFNPGPQSTTIDILDAGFVNTLEVGVYTSTITVSAQNDAP